MLVFWVITVLFCYLGFLFNCACGFVVFGLLLVCLGRFCYEWVCYVAFELLNSSFYCDLFVL